ncbi:MAG: DUF551 domain-containing protein [Pseudomonas sp.]|uniref:DUF551 domain-containing protein n=1 Tax=Pseudomonas sp. TaxID=306 RepID=UPI001A5F98B2|nr:DUF551 domain-containing protein [Pseudomonas sp.]MBL7231639.1 DUF551 domain-containing protein [Pseudomonas sp.]
MTDKMREEFEASVLSEYPNQNMGKFATGEYQSTTIEHCWWAWQKSRQALASHGWQSMEACPQHTEVLFYRSDAGVFSGMITDADHFLSDKERDEWSGTEQEMFDLDAFGFGDWGVCRCDGSERPTHWMPLPVEPEVKP